MTRPHGHVRSFLVAKIKTAKWRRRRAKSSGRRGRSRLGDEACWKRNDDEVQVLRGQRFGDRRGKVAVIGVIGVVGCGKTSSLKPACSLVQRESFSCWRFGGLAVRRLAGIMPDL